MMVSCSLFRSFIRGAKWLILIVLLFSAPAGRSAAAPSLLLSHVIYVNTAAAGEDDGSSWSNAYTDLQDALTAAAAGNEVWVAAGVYKPTTSSTDRFATFQLKSDVAIYGGFAGVETAREQRDWNTNVTVLSGDINNSDDLTGNSYHVVTGSGTIASAILDGFTVTAGNADGSNPNNSGGGMFNNNGSPTLSNLTFIGNSAAFGGGMGNTNSNPTLFNVAFIANTSGGGGGGGMFNQSSSPTLTNVIFSGNSTSNIGSGMRNNFNSHPTLTNVVFSGNRSITDGAIHNGSTSNPIIQNSIFWNNQPASVSNSSSIPTISYSLIQGCNPDGSWNDDCGINGGNNLLDTNPLFIETPDPTTSPTTVGNLRLLPGSPAIDVGNNAYVTGIDADLDGNPRIIGLAVDLGPYETYNYDHAWNGSQDSDWDNVQNWTPNSLPDSSSNVLVHPGHLFGAEAWPVLNVDAAVNDLIVAAGAALTTPSGRSLTINGDFINNGSLPDTLGTLIMNGWGEQILGGTITTLHHLEVNTQGEMAGYWPFDDGSGGTATDESGSGNHGTLVNAAWDNTDSAPTLFNNPASIFFNGSNARVTMPDPELPSSFTASLWMNAASVGGDWRHLLDYGTSENWVLGAFRLQVFQEGRFYVAISDGVLLHDLEVTNTDWQLNQWHHVALTYDYDEDVGEGVLRLYLDGEQVGTRNSSVNITGGAGTLIAGSFQGTDRFFHGNLDDIRLYSHALTPAAVAALAEGHHIQQGSVLLAAPLQVNGDLMLKQGLLDVSEDNHPLTIGGHWIAQGGDFEPRTGTVTFNGRNIQTVGGTIPTNLHHLTVDNQLTLAGYWPFDDGSGGAATDESGNDNHGTLVNATWDNTDSAPTLFDNPASIFFNGSNARVTMPDPGLSSSFSASLWFNAASVTDARHLLEYGTTEHEFSGAFRIQLRSQDNRIFVALGDGNAFDDLTIFNAGWNLNQWHHVAVTYDYDEDISDGLLRVYLDGVELDSRTSALNITGGTGTLIAGSFQGTERFFNGNLDDIRLYNQVLTPEEVAALAAGHDVQGNVLLTAPLQIDGDLTLKQGLLDVSEDNHPLTIGGNWIAQGGDFEHRTGTVTFNGRNIQTAGGTILTNLHHLTVDNQLTLAGYWPFDDGSGGTATDESGNGNHGVLVNAAWDNTDSAPILFDNPASIFFNGSNARVTMPDPGLPSSFSASLWFNAASVADARHLLEYGTAEHGFSGAFRIQLRSQDNRIFVALGDGNAFDDLTIFNAGWNLNQWHHVAVTYDYDEDISDGLLRVYLDGVELDSRTSALNITGGAGTLIAGSFQGTERFFNGNLDDIRLYNQVLTPEEVAALAAGHDVQGQVALASPLQIDGDLILDQGTLDVGADNHLVTIAGDFANNNGQLRARAGEVRFTGNGLQSLTLNRPTTFFDLLVGSETILQEMVSGNQAVVAGTLTNEGVIRHSWPVAGTGLLPFGLTGVSIDVTGQGMLTDIEVERVDSDHPDASGDAANVATGRYWTITPTGSGYEATLILPHDNLSDPKACRWLDGEGTGAGWDCARDEEDGFNADSVTRSGVTEFSDWSVGDEVGPTAVTLQGFIVHDTATALPLWGGILVLLLSFSFIWFWQSAVAKRQE